MTVKTRGPKEQIRSTRLLLLRLFGGTSVPSVLISVLIGGRQPRDENHHARVLEHPRLGDGHGTLPDGRATANVNRSPVRPRT